jgi:hypothetical protein
VKGDYIAELERQLADVARLRAGGAFDGPYFTEAQIRGRVQYVCWINPRRRKHLFKELSGIDWQAVRDEARRRGLEARFQRLVRSFEQTEMQNF